MGFTLFSRESAIASPSLRQLLQIIFALQFCHPHNFLKLFVYNYSYITACIFPEGDILEQKIQLAIENAGITCAKKGADSIECLAAWDVVDDLQSEIAHQRAEKQPTPALAEYCQQPIATMPQRIYENWCSS